MRKTVLCVFMYVRDLASFCTLHFSLIIFQAQQLTGLIRRGQHVHFTDLQLRHRQIQTSPVAVDRETGLRSTPILTLHYTIASNVTADKSPKPAACRSGLSTNVIVVHFFLFIFKR